MIDEGYIKFTLSRQEGGALALEAELSALNKVRTALFEKKLIGILDSGIGYGNVSIKSSVEADSLFVISGSATGGVHTLSGSEYCEVLSLDIDKNSLLCRGSINASSESMSHAAIYEGNSAITCVIHIHSRELFDYMLQHSYPKTPEDAAYGTPQIAHALSALVAKLGASEGLVVMAGHDEGIIAYGSDVDSAYNLLEELYNRVEA